MGKNISIIFHSSPITENYFYLKLFPHKTSNYNWKLFLLKIISTPNWSENTIFFINWKLFLSQIGVKILYFLETENYFHAKLEWKYYIFYKLKIISISDWSENTIFFSNWKLFPCKIGVKYYIFHKLKIISTPIEIILYSNFINWKLFP